MWRSEGPERGDDQNEQGRERDVQAPVAAAQEPANQEQERREQKIEPLLDRETPGDGVVVGRIR